MHKRSYLSRMRLRTSDIVAFRKLSPNRFILEHPMTSGLSLSVFILDRRAHCCYEEFSLNIHPWRRRSDRIYQVPSLVTNPISERVEFANPPKNARVTICQMASTNSLADDEAPFRAVDIILLIPSTNSCSAEELFMHLHLNFYCLLCYTVIAIVNLVDAQRLDKKPLYPQGLTFNLSTVLQHTRLDGARS